MGRDIFKDPSSSRTFLLQNSGWFFPEKYKAIPNQVQLLGTSLLACLKWSETKKEREKHTFWVSWQGMVGQERCIHPLHWWYHWYFIYWIPGRSSICQEDNEEFSDNLNDNSRWTFWHLPGHRKPTRRWYIAASIILEWRKLRSKNGNLRGKGNC